MPGMGKENPLTGRHPFRWHLVLAHIGILLNFFDLFIHVFEFDEPHI